VCIQPNKWHGREQALQGDAPKEESEASTMLVDGDQLTREIILLRSPATAPEKKLLPVDGARKEAASVEQ
jgi:hypothetical protein